MLSVALLFCSFATLALGSIAWAVGGPGMLGELLGGDAQVWRDRWAILTVFVTIAFFAWSIGAFVVRRRSN